MEKILEATKRKMDNNIPIPLYYQLKEVLKEKILKGSFKKGRKFPGS